MFTILAVLRTEPSQPCEATGAHAWLNLGAKYSWAWLARNCLAVEALY